ncbi:MAG: MarR family transcriptional regulator [Lachnospiraceae bacterium]|nr:MarR family transcriptional regulator [Lachnospiraceae bacterium]
MTTEYDSLKLSNQLCFPFYACSKEIIRLYKPFLDELDLTYTQYITMMVLWEHHTLTSKELGKLLHLDSGTLTPLLKKLEHKGLLIKLRSPEDERNLVLTLTDAGEALKEKAVQVPPKIASCIPMTEEEGLQVYQALQTVLHALGLDKEA